jgi:predicted XRE-type DNA-binding protein
MTKVPFEKSSGNAVAEIGSTSDDAEELAAKSNLIMALRLTMARRELTPVEAAALCETDQSMLSKVLRGRMEGVTAESLVSWLSACGRIPFEKSSGNVVADIGTASDDGE